MDMMAKTDSDLRVVDADSHFTEPMDWFQRANPKLASEIPPVPFEEMVIDVVTGDLLNSMPPDARPSDPLNILPRHFKAAILKMREMNPSDQQKAFAAFELPAPHNEGAERVAWMDAHGIDAQILVPSNGASPYKQAKRAGLKHLQNAALETYNTWAAERVHGHTDRQIGRASCRERV